MRGNVHGRRVAPLRVLSFVNGQNVKTLRFVPRSSNVEGSRGLGVGLLASLTREVFLRHRGIELLPSRSLAVRSLVTMNASTNNHRPGTVVTVGPGAKRVEDNRVTNRGNFSCYVLGFNSTRHSSTRLRVTCCGVTETTNVDVVPYEVVRVRNRGRFVARHFSHSRRHGLRVRALTTLCPSTSDCRGLLVIYQGVHLPRDARRRIFHEVMFGVLTGGASSRGGGFSFLVSRDKG